MFRFGCKRDLPDPRDHVFAAPRTGAAVPESFSMRAHVKRVLDQDASSSCVANAYAQAVAITEDMAGLPYDPISRLYLYSCARAITGDEFNDGGTQLRNGAKALQVMGAPPESCWPFDLSKVNAIPGIKPHMLAHPRRGGSYSRITGTGDALIQQVKVAISSGYPVVFGTLTNDAFMNCSGPELIARPGPYDAIAGAHALCIDGYDPDGVEIVNSWGDSAWGDHGFARLSWDYMTWDQTYDLWLVRSWVRIQEARAKHDAAQKGVA
jgi:hypothetical protein